MDKMVDAIRSGGILVSDGAWGTFLAVKGLQPGECPEKWNLDRRDDVLDIARGYAEAGALVLGTNTFGGTRFKLEHFGLADQVARINETGAALSREAAGPDRHVCGSMGPTGKILMMGDVTEDEVYEAYRDQAVALEKGGADACVVETQSALDEAALGIRAAKEHTGLEVAATFTFEDKGKGGFRTMMGVSPGEMARAALDAGADIIGANCGQGPKGMCAIVAEIRAAAPDTPIMAQANAGLPVQKDGTTTFPATPEMMAEDVPALVDAGANIIGGCCGTMPEHIRAIADAVARVTN